MPGLLWRDPPLRQRDTIPNGVAGIIAAGRHERSRRQSKEQTSEHRSPFKKSTPTNDDQRTNRQPNRCQATTLDSQ